VASNGTGGRHGERQGGAGTGEVHDAARFYRGEERAFTAKGHPGLNSQYNEQPRPARAGGTRGGPVDSVVRGWWRGRGLHVAWARTSRAMECSQPREEAASGRREGAWTPRWARRMRGRARRSDQRDVAA
jgi:hypothetical protein